MAVSNSYSDLLPTLWAMAATEVRQNSVMPRLVMNLSDNIAGTPGASVQIPDQPTGTTRAVTHDITPADPSNLALTATTLTLSNWREAPFTIDDKMAAEVVSGTVPRVLRAYAQALAAYIDSQIMALYTGVYNTGASADFGGGATAVPSAFTLNATNNPTSFRAWNEADVLLNQLGAPRMDRAVILSAFDEGAASITSQFMTANERGDQGGILDNRIGHKLGSDWWMDQAIPTHTAGTVATTASQTVKAVGASAAGVTTIALNGTITSDLTVAVGDVFKFANHNQTYVNDTLVTATTNTLTLSAFSPALKTAVTTDTAVTFLGSHKVNLIAHPDAIAFASRPFGGIGGGNYVQAFDEVSGLNLRVELARQHKQDYMSIDALFGTVLREPRLIARIASSV